MCVQSSGMVDQITDLTNSAKDIRTVTLWGLALNLVLSAAKIVFGLFSSSQSLIMDGVHSVSDSVTDMGILIGRRFWSAPPDANHPHGHGRIETLITAGIGFIVLGTGIGLVFRALSSIPNAVGISAPWPVLIVALASWSTKESLYRWTRRVGERCGSEAVVANAWHHRSDAYSSIPVMLAVIGKWVRPDWAYLDPVAAILVGVFVMRAAVEIVWPALKELADTAPSGANRAALRRIVIDTKGVAGTHALRVRRVGPRLHVDLHIQVDSSISVHDGHAIAHDVKQRLLDAGLNVVDVVVHVEPLEAIQPGKE